MLLCESASRRRRRSSSTFRTPGRSCAGRDRVAPHRRRARALPDTDWHVDKLYAFARVAGATVLVGDAFALRRRPESRSDRAPRSIRAPTTRSCARRARSTIIRSTTATPPSGCARSRRDGERISIPYHARSPREIERVRDRHGYAILLDGHSIRAARSRAFFARTPAGPQSRHRRRRELRAVGVGAPPPRCLRGRRGVHARRQRPLQGRLRDAPLRASPRAACMRCSSRSRRRATWTRPPPSLGMPARAQRAVGRARATRRSRSRSGGRGARDRMIRFYIARSGSTPTCSPTG